MSGSLVSARGLFKRFGSVIAADNVSVELCPRERVGIIGANGAGKTTFVNIVTGYLKPDDGSIFFRGIDITGMTPREITRLGIRRSFQVSQLFSNLSVRDTVLVALAAAVGAFPSPCADRGGGKNSGLPRARWLGRISDYRAAAGTT